MSKKQNERVGIYVDGANIFYGLNNQRIDFEHFRDWLAEGREIKRFGYFNSGQKHNQEVQKFFAYLRAIGVKTYVKQMTQNSVTKEYKQEGVDVYLSVKALKHADEFDTLILVSGDYDFLPLIHEMNEMNKKVEIVSFQKSMHPIYKRFRYRYMEDYLETAKEVDNET